MRWFGVGLLLGVTLTCAAATGAGATENMVCHRQARDRLRSCLAVCLDEHQEARDICRNIDPVCGDVCRARRAACLTPFLATLTGCLDTCQTRLNTDKADCPPEGNAGHDACIDAAQMKAHLCRETCRENQTERDGIRACRKAFRTCLKACPPPPPATPGPTPTP